MTGGAMFLDVAAVKWPIFPYEIILQIMPPLPLALLCSA
jgi:hypothetical protein